MYSCRGQPTPTCSRPSDYLFHGWSRSDIVESAWRGKSIFPLRSLANPRQWLYMLDIFGSSSKIKYILYVAPLPSSLCFLLGQLPPIPDSPAWDVAGCAIHRLSIALAWLLFLWTTTATSTDRRQYRGWLAWSGLGFLATFLAWLSCFAVDLDRLIVRSPFCYSAMSTLI